MGKAKVDVEKVEAGITMTILGNINDAQLALFRMNAKNGGTKYLRDLCKFKLEQALDLLQELDPKVDTK